MEIPKIIIPQMTGFSIYNPNTGQFSRGGFDPRWSKKGKIWSTIAHLKNHINGALVYTEYKQRKFVVQPYYNGCIVVDVQTNEEASIKIKDYVLDFIERKKSESKYYKDWGIICK